MAGAAGGGATSATGGGAVSGVGCDGGDAVAEADRTAAVVTSETATTGGSVGALGGGGISIGVTPGLAIRPVVVVGSGADTGTVFAAGTRDAINGSTAVAVVGAAAVAVAVGLALGSCGDAFATLEVDVAAGAGACAGLALATARDLCLCLGAALGGVRMIGPFGLSSAFDGREPEPRLSSTLQSTVTEPVGSVMTGARRSIVPEPLMITGPLWAHAVPPSRGRARRPRRSALLGAAARRSEDALGERRSAERRIRLAIP
jgi:hypothetical protein